MSKSCDSGCGLADDMVVDVSDLGPDIEAMVFDRVTELQGIRGAETPGNCRAAGGVVEGVPFDASAEVRAKGFVCSAEPAVVYRAGSGDAMGQFVPKFLDPAGFLGGNATGAIAAEAASRLIFELTDVRPVFVTAGATGLSLLAHLVSGSSFTFGLFTGTLPLLLAMGVDAVLDLAMGEPGGGALLGDTKQGARVGQSSQVGQLTRRSVDEIKRLLKRLEPRAQGASRPAVQAGVGAGDGLAGNLSDSVFPQTA